MIRRILPFLAVAALSGLAGYVLGRQGGVTAPAAEGGSNGGAAASTRDDEGDAAAARPEPEPEPEPEGRNPRWARPFEKPGVPNFHKVSDGLYRSAQPSAEGMRELKDLGVKTVVNLRQFHSDRDEIGETGLGYEHIYFNPFHPEDKEIVRFLQIVSRPERAPVLVHCKHGADRTGTVCALYRVCVEGWSKEDAIEELKEGGYGHHESLFGNLITYIRKLDVEAIRKRAGLE
ncbi:MAG: tyrosine-protein phosphatase [Planctomycetota bacterium]|nr:tyrosine-protein phosphatase [Planctomycetota bacterium]